MAPVNNELCAIEVSGRSSSFALFPVARRGSLSRKAQEAALPAGQRPAKQSQLPVWCSGSCLRSDLSAESALRVLHRCPVHSQGPSAPRRSDTAPTPWLPLPCHGRSGLAGLRNLRKLAAQCVIDDLFIQSGLEHGCTSLQFSFYYSAR